MSTWTISRKKTASYFCSTYSYALSLFEDLSILEALIDMIQYWLHGIKKVRLIKICGGFAAKYPTLAPSLKVEYRASLG